MSLDRENGDQLLTVQEAAKIFPVGIKKIYELAGEDGCPFVLHIGMHKIMIKKNAFEEFLFSSYSI